MAFPESGNYWFPGGLTTVEIDRAGGCRKLLGAKRVDAPCGLIINRRAVRLIRVSERKRPVSPLRGRRSPRFADDLSDEPARFSGRWHSKTTSSVSGSA